MLSRTKLWQEIFKKPAPPFSRWKVSDLTQSDGVEKSPESIGGYDVNARLRKLLSERCALHLAFLRGSPASSRQCKIVRGSPPQAVQLCLAYRGHMAYANGRISKGARNNDRK